MAKVFKEINFIISKNINVKCNCGFNFGCVCLNIENSWR